MAYWRGKVVLVTGGSLGFGKVLAESFVRAGAQVIITARDAERLAAAGQLLGGQVVGVAADVTRDDQVAALFDQAISRFGRLDALVNNVGRSMRGLVAETHAEAFRELLEVNFLSAVRCTQAALPHLESSRGHLVFMGSLASKSVSRYLGAYPATKFALAAYAQQLRLELRPAGVHVLLVCPGPIARVDTGTRYDDQAAKLPPAARQAGAGVKLQPIPPQRLASRILAACERRSPEIVIPPAARLLFALSQLFPSLGDWIIRRRSP